MEDQSNSKYKGFKTFAEQYKVYANTMSAHEYIQKRSSSARKKRAAEAKGAAEVKKRRELDKPFELGGAL